MLALIVVLLPLAVLAAGPTEPTEGLRAEGSTGPPVLACATIPDVTVELSKAPPITDNNYFTGSSVKIDAVAHVVYQYLQGGGCIYDYEDLTDNKWDLTTPNGNTTTVQTGGFSYTTSLAFNGQYVVTFTACPNTCFLQAGPNNPVTVHIKQVTVTMNAVDSLPIPPQAKAKIADLGLCQNSLPPFNIDNPSAAFDPCKATPFTVDHLSSVCNNGGGVIDPQWVTVRPWSNASDYVMAEGRMVESSVAREDNTLDDAHHSQDVDMKLEVDPPYRYLISTDFAPDYTSRDLATEWETGSWPEQYRPQAGDRVSLFGYWIHDCGHTFSTELHPPVGAVTDRERAISIPAGEGLGSNLVLPGIESDVWFNADGGGITSCLGRLDLHQPGTTAITVGSDTNCIPLGADPGDGGYSPLRRVFNYNIMLPPNPGDILKAVGKQNPPHVKLYVGTAFPPGIPQPSIEFKQDANGVGYLHVTMDLTHFTGTTYHGNIETAWEYPSPDNWGLKRYNVSLRKIDVHEDSDWTCHDTLCPGTWGGDWHMWMVTSNQSEWTKLMACNDCEFDDTTDTFGGRPWETGPTADADRFLGPDLFLYPEQLIHLMLTGYEDDGIETSDSLNTLDVLKQQPTADTLYSERNVCTPLDPEFEIPLPIIPNISVAQSNCADYTAYFEIAPEGAFTPQLSASGQAMYDASLLHSSDLHPCFAHLIITCWDENPPLTYYDWHPDGTHPNGPAHLTDTDAFEAFPLEDLTWNDMDPMHLKGLLASLPGDKLDMLLQDLSSKPIRPDHPAMEYAILEGVLPPGKFQQYFGDVQFNWPIWGDTSCDGAITVVDALRLLRAIVGLHGADCFNVGNVDCSADADAVDALAILRHVAGLPALTGASANCPAIGEKLHLTIPALSGTPTPTAHVSPTPTPTATPAVTPTPTPTPTVTPTPTASPSPSPSPTPDTTGPSITNVAANPDGNNPNYVYDNNNNGLCPNTVTTISASISDPSGLSTVELFVRYYDGMHPPTNYTNVGPTFNGGTQKWEKAIDYPLDAIGPDPANIQYFWEAFDNSPQHNVTVAPPVNPNVVPIADCQLVIP